MTERGERVVMVAAPGNAPWSTTAAFAGLLRRGYDATLVLPATKETEWQAPPEFEPGDDARVHRLDARRLRLSLRPRSFRAIVRGTRPKLVHFTGADAVDLIAATLPPDVRVVVALHALDVVLTAREGPDRFASSRRRPDAVVYPDHAVEARAATRGLPTSSDAAVIAPAVDVDFFAPGPQRSMSSSVHLVSIDGLEWRAGFEHAIHSVSLLRDAGVDCRYTIAGAGSYETALSYAAHQLGVADVVSFAGPLDRRQRRDLLRTADVFVSASVVDGLPPGLPEAMAAGLPVVMTTPGPVRDEGPKADAATAVRRRDPFALADAARSVIDDPERAGRMGAAARAHALEWFALDRHVDALADLYARLLSSAQ